MGVSSLALIRRHNSSSSPCAKAYGEGNVRGLCLCSIQSVGEWPMHGDFQVAMFEVVFFVREGPHSATGAVAHRDGLEQTKQPKAVSQEFS